MSDVKFAILAYVFVITSFCLPFICPSIHYVVKMIKEMFKGCSFESEHKEAVDFRKEK